MFTSTLIVHHAIKTKKKKKRKTQELTLWLEIPVDEAHQMQVFERGRNLCRIKSGRILVDALARPRLQRAKELAATAVLHTEIQRIVRLERMVQSDDERMIACGENFLFGESSLNLVALDHFLLGKD